VHVARAEQGAGQGQPRQEDFHRFIVARGASLVTQSVDGVEARRAARWYKTKQHTNRR
jgi:hypothetical protein